jgi:hypothetical protein
MPLADLQSRFVSEILFRQAPELHAQIVTNGLSAERRLAIYRTNARENFALALEAAFPLLLACVGGEEFRRLAWAYQRACPSPAGNLYHVGARLPGFLEEHVRGTGDDYQIDVARLEWAVQEALVAADDEAQLDLAALAAVPAGRQGDIRFRLHPSVRLLRTDYGVFRLWEAMQAGQPVARAVRDPECLLVRRQAAGVQLQRLTRLDLAWLEALGGGGDLAESATVIPVSEQDELGALLVRWVTAGVVADFTVDRPVAVEARS